MKKLWRTLGTIVLGMAFLTGCGDESAGVTLSGQPIDQAGIGTESHGQSGQEQSGEKITLTLGALGTDRRLQSAVESYNAQSGKYYVEIVDYLPEHYDNVVWETSQDRFRMDLATGKGTDIIMFGDLVADELGYAGVLIDLNTFLTSGDKQEKYLGNILECAQTGDALYEISPAFTLEFIVGMTLNLAWKTVGLWRKCWRALRKAVGMGRRWVRVEYGRWPVW